MQSKSFLKKRLWSGVAILVAANLLLMAGSLWKERAPQDMLAPPTEGVTITADPDGSGPLPDGVPRMAGELVVDLVDGLEPDEVRQVGRDYGLILRYNSIHSLESCLTVADVAESDMGSLLARLSSDPRVQSVSPNYVYQLLADEVPAADFPNDPRFKEQWHMDQINVTEAWPWTVGRHVVVSVIDTGVAYRDMDRFHRVEDLDQTAFVNGYDFVNKRVEALDDHAHGTHVAGTIAQSTNNGKGVAGVAWGAAIMPVKVLSGRGSGTLADVADGIRFSADHGATVINMSLGGPFPDATMADAVRYAHSKGSLVVCAAGNSSRGKSGYPAGYPEAVSISAVDRNEELTFYTNYGPDIDLAAPGGDTRRDPAGGVLQNTIHVQNPTKSDYFFFQGTSMASPHAAGVAALVASLGVTQPDALLKVLQGTARSKGEEGKERGFGAGVIDAERAAFRAGFAYPAWQLLIAMVVVALAIMPMIRRGAFHHVVLTLPGAVFASSGLFFLPALLGMTTPFCPYITRGFPSWDMLLLGAANHGNPIMFSCLLPMVLAILVVEKPALRAVVAGFTAGVAGHLLFTALVGSVAVMFVPAFLSRLWLVGNGLICVFLAIVLAEEQP